MVFSFEIEKLLEHQLKEVDLWHKAFVFLEFTSPVDFPKLMSLQHQANFELWHQEDMARDRIVSDSKIASIKRRIDVLNQKRNDLIEKMDYFLVNVLQKNKVKKNLDSEMNSETPGNIIDRLSINALKIYHMEEETKRNEVNSKHRDICEGKLYVLREQRRDLGKCLIKLLDDLSSGKKFLKVYQQMKMYNDESLNPVLYGRKRKS